MWVPHSFMIQLFINVFPDRRSLKAPSLEKAHKPHPYST